MTLRGEVVRERLRKLRDVLRKLEEIATLSGEAFNADFRRQWVAERGLQIMAEAVLDIGNHLLVAGLNVTPRDYEDVITQLGKHGVISAGLGARLRGLGGFRNILVHAYLDLDPQRVYQFATTRLDDFRDFALEIESWLESRANG